MVIVRLVNILANWEGYSKGEVRGRQLKNKKKVVEHVSFNKANTDLRLGQLATQRDCQVENYLLTMIKRRYFIIYSFYNIEIKLSKNWFYLGLFNSGFYFKLLPCFKRKWTGFNWECTRVYLKKNTKKKQFQHGNSFKCKQCASTYNLKNLKCHISKLTNLQAFYSLLLFSPKCRFTNL